MLEEIVTLTLSAGPDGVIQKGTKFWVSSEIADQVEEMGVAKRTGKRQAEVQLVEESSEENENETDEDQTNEDNENEESLEGEPEAKVTTDEAPVEAATVKPPETAVSRRGKRGKYA